MIILTIEVIDREKLFEGNVHYQVSFFTKIILNMIYNQSKNHFMGSMIISPWTTALRTIVPREIPPRPLPPRLLSPTQLPLNNYPLDNFPRTITPYGIPSGQLPHWISAPDNYSWRIPPGQLPPDNYPHEIPAYVIKRNTKEWVKLMIGGNKTNSLEKIIWVTDIFI